MKRTIRKKARVPGSGGVVRVRIVLQVDVRNLDIFGDCRRRSTRKSIWKIENQPENESFVMVRCWTVLTWRKAV